MKMKIVGIIITIAIIIIGIGIITYNDDSVLMKTDTGIIIETNSGINNDKLELIESELPIIEPIIESELPIIEPIIESELISITEPEPEPVWTIPIEIATQPLVEPIQELTKIIKAEPQEPQRISTKDITLNHMMLNSGYYSVFNSNPDQAIDGVFYLHIFGHIPIIVKNIHIPANSNYPMKTDLFLGDCGGIGTGDPLPIPCKKKFVMTFYDMKIPRNAHPMKMQDWRPLNQCVGLVDENGNISNKCKNNIFQQVVGIYEKNDRW